jgi:hypothetical protein
MENTYQKNNKTTRHIPQLDLPEQGSVVGWSIRCLAGPEMRAPVLNRKMKKKIFFFGGSYNIF